jgi:hypothetical protein
MDGFAFSDKSMWRAPVQELPGYNAGNALGWLYLSDKQASTNHFLMGRLYVAKSGWLLLSVPNALVRGVFDALHAPGAQLPTCGSLNVPNEKPELLNAHISVMTSDEVNKIGADNITERGHMFGYSLGQLRELAVNNVEGVSKVWAINVNSPELAALRRSYGLLPLIKENKPFHVTVAVRRRNVLRENEISKCYKTSAQTENEPTFRNTGDLLPGGKADNVPDSKFDPKELAVGVKDEREHTDNDQIAKEIAEDHLSSEPDYYTEEEKHKEAAEIVKAAARRIQAQPQSVYMQQLARNWQYRGKTLPYDSSKTVYENVQNQLAEAKRRGDFIRQSQRNYDLYRSTLDPAYRHRLALDALNNRLPVNPLDEAIERYGDEFLSNFSARS